MPYITQEDRKLFDRGLSHLRVPGNAGQLNYVITRIVHEYIEAQGKKYETLNSVVGVLDCAKMELYRRVAAPYEDVKIEENGDL